MAAADLDIAALGIREAPQMHCEEDFAVDVDADSQNSIYNQMAEHERLLAAQNGMLLFPSRSQSVGYNNAEEEETEEERIDKMLKQLNQEKATSYRCTMETNKILKKREVRADGSAPCPFAKVKEAFDQIVLMEDGAEKTAQIKQYNMIVELFELARARPKLRAGINQIFGALDNHYMSKNEVQTETEYLIALNKRHAIVEKEKIDTEAARRAEERTKVLMDRLASAGKKRARHE